MASTDELTTLHNRRFFLERWNEEVARAKRYRRNLSCLVIDVNGFKQINDQTGHLMGDLVLRQVSSGLRKQLRKTDLLARFGGDEFVVALPETEMAQASRVAKKLRGLDFNREETLARDRVGPVSLSVGVAQLQENDSPLAVIERADQDLYASRRGTQVSKVMEWAPAESTFR
jgi:diguanylate cyclase (GGDEF)-like protein